MIEFICKLRFGVSQYSELCDLLKNLHMRGLVSERILKS